MLTLKNGGRGNGGYPMRGMHTNWNVAAARRARQLSLSLSLSFDRLVRPCFVTRPSSALPSLFFSLTGKIPSRSPDRVPAPWRTCAGRPGLGTRVTERRSGPSRALGPAVKTSREQSPRKTL